RRDHPLFPTRRSSDLEAAPAHRPRIVEIATIEDQRLAHAAVNFVEGRRTEFLPFRQDEQGLRAAHRLQRGGGKHEVIALAIDPTDRKSTRLNSSHVKI